MRRALIVLAAAGLVACGPPPGPQYGGASGACGPWVNTGQSPQFPDMMYLTAVGHGPEITACEAGARAEIAKIFKAQVSQQTTEWQGYFSRATAAGASFKEVTDIQSYTTVCTDKSLNDFGVEIKTRCQAPGTFHCLAVIERDKASSILRDKMAKLDQEIASLVVEGDKAGDQTTKFMRYSAAMEKLAERELLNIDLKIISSGRGGMQPPVEWASLIAKFTGAKGAVKVGLKITGTEAAKIQTCMAEGLGRKGLQVLEGTSDVDVVISGQLKYAKAGFVAGSEMVRADINLRVVGMSDGRTLAAFTDDVKVGRPSLQQSVQLAVTKLCEKAIEELPKKIFDSFKR
jgi:hypothetical protein